MLWWWAAQTAAVACESDYVTIESDDGVPVWWPGRSPAPTDTIIVLSSSDELPDLRLYDPAGAELVTARYDLRPAEGPALIVLVPAAPLAPGEGYVVASTPYETYTFEVGPDPAPPPAPPVPVTRDMFGEVTWLDPDCPEEAWISSGLTYRLCPEPVIAVSVIAEQEPPAPSLSAWGDLWPHGYGSVGAAYEPAGAAGTAWLGGIDAAGRFTGWTADPFVLPPVGTRTSERAEGVSGGVGTTPTTVPDCPDEVIWRLESSQTCEAFDVETHLCVVAPSDTGAVAAKPGEGEAGCGCATGDPLAPPVGLLFGLLGALTRSRRGFRSRTRRL